MDRVRPVDCRNCTAGLREVYGSAGRGYIKRQPGYMYPFTVAAQGQMAVRIHIPSEAATRYRIGAAGLPKNKRLISALLREQGLHKPTLPE